MKEENNLPSPPSGGPPPSTSTTGGCPNMGRSSHSSPRTSSNDPSQSLGVYSPCRTFRRGSRGGSRCGTRISGPRPPSSCSGLGPYDALAPLVLAVVVAVVLWEVEGGMVTGGDGGRTKQEERSRKEDFLRSLSKVLKKAYEGGGPQQSTIKG